MRGAPLYCGRTRREETTISSSVAHSGWTDSGRALRITARSDPGRVRPNNEDAVGFVADEGIAVLADGMGGLNAGEVASRHAVDLVLQGLTAGLPLGQVVEDANRTIFQLSQSEEEYHNMGTTLVALRAANDKVWLANVGDSRIYRFRAGELVQLTTDHSVVQQYVDSGLMSEDEARSAPNRNIITRALGIEREVQVDLLESDLATEDTFMLCSDGVSDMLEPEALQALFQAEPDAPALVDAIVEAANSAGGLDNISVVLVQVVEESADAQ